LARLEAGNFWFVARNRLIRWMVMRYLLANGSYLEVGCGTGFVLQMLCKTFPKWRIYATEAQPEGIGFARQRVPADVSFFQMDACNIPFRDEFDAIGAFDVIEHIPDDVAAIAQIFSALKPGGHFVLSVPQHMFLWSKYDEAGCHFRRYSAAEIESKLKVAGFSIVVSTSFNSLLLPLMMLSRAMKKGDGAGQVDVLEELRLSSTVNTALSIILRIEFLLIRFGVRFPVGGSRIVVAQKTAC
jgi:SAM-dependent methyltransferase